MEIEQIRTEIADELTGLQFGKVFQLDPMSLAVDFFPHSGRYLFLSFGPRHGATYLIRRRLKELERDAMHQTPFAINLRKLFFGMEFIEVSRFPGSKALRFDFRDVHGNVFSLANQLGRHRPNLFVLDKDGTVIESGKAGTETGQKAGEKYVPPIDEVVTSDEVTRNIDDGSLSDLLDAESRSRESAEQFDHLAATARRSLNSEIQKRVKLIKNLENDLLKHGEPDKWKRYGDLLLDNMGNIRREGDMMIVTDYFDSEMPDVEVPVDPNASPSDTAETYFKRYTKARNGVAAISARLDTVNSEIASLRTRMSDLEAAILTRDGQALADFLPAKKPPMPKAKVKKELAEVRGARRFISSDGYEILVGKKAVDNDFLTFRVARSLDTWLHAADYPGSHVIVRNPGKKDIPAKTLIEAARLAAFYSDARELPKAAVRYTQRKFVNKPRKSAPGLVSLSSFKTILVEPQIGDLAAT
jgi:predicted ribosome quality control (RQC) complex YloA/Tae2 family protein